MFLIFYSTYADASMYQGPSCRGFTLLVQLLKSKNSVLASSANMSKLLLLSDVFGWNETFVKQADSSLLFPLLMKALERCVYYPIILPFRKVRIYGDINTSFLGKVRIKTHRFL